MNINYNSLDASRDTWSKNEVGEVIGSPPNSTTKVTFNKWLSCMMMLFLFLTGFSSLAQTTLVSPTGDGGFENGATLALNGWTGIASTQSFFVGAPTPASAGSNCAYTSTTSGSWTPGTASSVAHIYRDIAIPPGETIITITCKYKVLAVDASFDFLKVFLIPTSITPVAGTQLTVGQIGTTAGYDGTTAYVTTTIGASALAGTTQRFVLSYTQDGVVPFGAAAIDEISVVSAAPATFTATATGGLWNSPATWVGGVVPGSGNDVTIPTGSIVTVNQVLSYKDMNIAGTLQWGTGSFAVTLSGNLNVTSTGKLYPYTTGNTGQIFNIAGNLNNDGYANFALPNTALTFNGSGSTISGSGVFQGDGTRGIVRALTFSNTGSNSITTSQNLTITAGLAHLAGSLNTNGKLKIDNTAQVYGQALNLQVANVPVTAMGSLYTVAPVVFGATVIQWASITGVLNTMYVSGTNVYRCSTTGSIGATAPTHTSGITNNLLWIGTTGTLGNPFLLTAAVVGTQYFYGGNLYTCIAAGTPLATAPPVHTSGTALSGTTAIFRYIGTPAQVSVNYDSVTQTVRTLNLVNAGSGYSSAPSAAFSVGVLAGTGSGATAAAVYIQQVADPPLF